jgi:peroxiredoxin
LVQLQADLEKIKAAGIQVVGVSYDSVAVLKKFSYEHKISFPLLSDPGSKTIDAYHIRNEAAKGKAEGVPNPGTFIVDKSGVIRAKLFLEGYRTRHTTDELIRAAKAVQNAR